MDERLLRDSKRTLVGIGVNSRMITACIMGTCPWRLRGPNEADRPLRPVSAPYGRSFDPPADGSPDLWPDDFLSQDAYANSRGRTSPPEMERPSVIGFFCFNGRPMTYSWRTGGVWPVCFPSRDDSRSATGRLWGAGQPKVGEALSSEGRPRSHLFLPPALGRK